ncbi:MAG: helix-turn-helix transcriptional regulator [candidate division NC10 bacterium]|nr:helix-turn-helix transcriptional regulator [candidate division NC10 bacterium]
MPRVMDAAALKAKLFRGFGDPTRLAILERLLGREQSVGEIAEAVEGNFANISAHLACLAECGLVEGERRGKYVYYRLRERRVRDLMRIAEAILADVSRQIYQCTRFER